MIDRQDNIKIERINPTNVPAPVGKYSHVTKIPKNADIYAFSGQIGVDSEGNLPIDFSEQIVNTMSNISGLLSSQYMTQDNIIKVNIWATKELDWNFFDEEWDKFFGEQSPSMTFGYIAELGLPEIKIEIEIWAAK